MTDVLIIEVGDLGQMLRGWMRLREVFRAVRKPDERRVMDAEVTIFKPFLVGFERKNRGAPVSTEAWLKSARAESRDALDLRLHEVDWHLIRHEKDRAGVTGIGANTMATRTKTTTDAERAEAIARIIARYPRVIFR